MKRTKHKPNKTKELQMKEPITPRLTKGQALAVVGGVSYPIH